MAWYLCFRVCVLRGCADLTVQEHLLFYARLKGIPISLECEHVAHAMVEVGLEDFAQRCARALSGGMRKLRTRMLIHAVLVSSTSPPETTHPSCLAWPPCLHCTVVLVTGRRLSLAIACVGHSRIVFFDEPTTGLDPGSRKRVHAILQRMKAGRAVVLTVR
jgi:ABC-type multidrug transport system ATPase subunit